MVKKIYLGALSTIAVAFTIFFFATMGPPFIQNPDLVHALSSGFVNPYASGYSTDVILCWLVLLAWVLYERKTQSIKYGWVAPLLGAIPGVVVGFACYLVIRELQTEK